jgi:hypothetical protein
VGGPLWEPSPVLPNPDQRESRPGPLDVGLEHLLMLTLLLVVFVPSLHALLLLPYHVVLGLGGAHMVVVRATAEPLVADIARVKGEDGGKCAWAVLGLSVVALLPAPSQGGPALSGISSALNTSVKYMSQMSKATLSLYCKAQAGESDRIAVLATKSSLRIGDNPQALIYTLDYCARQLGIKPWQR